MGVLVGDGVAVSDGVKVAVSDGIGVSVSVGVGVKVGGTGLGADARAEYESLHEVIAKLPDDTEVWPGHDVGVDPSSTVGREKETNPFYLQPDIDSFVDLKRNWAEYKREHGIA